MYFNYAKVLVLLENCHSWRKTLTSKSNLQVLDHWVWNFGLTILSLMSGYWHLLTQELCFKFLKKISLTLRDTCNELLKSSVTKTYSAGFNNDAELPYKKLIQKINLSGEILCNSIKRSDWLRKYLGHRAFRYGRSGYESPPPNFYILPVKAWLPPTVT